MPVHRRVTSSITFASTHLCIWVERGTVRVTCLAQEHNGMSLARVQTWTARSGDKLTNHETTVPPTLCEITGECLTFNHMHMNQGLHWHFQQEDNWFSQVGKTSWTEILRKKNFPLDGQTSQAKSSSQPVNLPSARPFIKPLTWMKTVHAETWSWSPAPQVWLDMQQEKNIAQRKLTKEGD